jgi:hypothetical protein
MPGSTEAFDPFGRSRIRPKEPIPWGAASGIETSRYYPARVRPTATGTLSTTATERQTMSAESEQSPAPPITEQMRQQAKQLPNGWLYIVDPGYDEYGDDVPPEGIVGAYHIDSTGEIDEQFQHNDQYQPSEHSFALPEPTNELERVLNRIATGNAPDVELPPAVLAADLLLYSASSDDDVLYTAEMSDGSELVPACTSEARVPRDWPGYRRVPGRTVTELLDGRDLGLNLDDDVRAVIPHAILVETAAED